MWWVGHDSQSVGSRLNSMYKLFYLDGHKNNILPSAGFLPRFVSGKNPSLNSSLIKGVIMKCEVDLPYK